jgi:hypothetical protein
VTIIEAMSVTVVVATLALMAVVVMVELVAFIVNMVWSVSRKYAWKMPQMLPKMKKEAKYSLNHLLMSLRES